MENLKSSLRLGNGWLRLLTLPAVAIGALVSLWVPLGSPLIVKSVLPKWGIISSISGLKQAAVLAVATDNIREAINIIDEERVRTRAERDAFDSFIDCIKTLPTESVSLSMNLQRSVAEGDTRRGDQLQELREAYRKSVMNVAHYEEEYNDTLAESVKTEFDPELGGHLASGQAFTPIVKQRLLEAAHQRRQAREEFLSTLESEKEALNSAQSSLEGVAEALDEITASLSSDQLSSDLICDYTRLDEAERTCETLLHDRQQQRSNNQTIVDTHGQSVHDLHSYLYQPLSVTYPVLADATSLLETLQETQKQLTRELATRY